MIRRVTFDLTGLPPTLAEIDAFLADPAPDAYERLVDRLLASPRFGERMAVDWLDLARYADTYGYQADVYRAMWPWRDWVVQAFNANLPYDQFITWQLAGDLLPEPDPRPGPGHGVQPPPSPDQRGGQHRGRVPRRVRRRPDQHLRDRVPGADPRVRPLPQPQVRPDHPERVLSTVWLLQQHRRVGAVLAFHRRRSDPDPAPDLARPGSGDRGDRSEDQDGRGRARSPGRRATAGVRGLAQVAEARREPVLTGLIGDFPLDDIEGGKVVNRADPKKPGQTSENPELVEGRVGKGLRLSGENNVTLPLGNFDRFEPFSLALWIKTPDFKDRAVIIHRSMAWTDAGSRGYQLLIEDGKLSVGLIHFWPGNAIGIRAREPVPLNQWIHVAITYDGSSRAGGLALYVDGRPRRLRGRPRPSDQEHHRRRQRSSHRRPAVPRPRVQERPG